jgi:glycosyltransferase involved in cell wall biosynthesis
MRVLHYVASLTRSAGGLHTAVTGLTSALAGVGVDVVVAGTADEFVDDVRNWRVSQTVPVSNGYQHVGQFFSVVRRTAPDLIHIQGIWGPISMFGLAASFRAPVVVSPHGMLDPWILSRRPRLKALHGLLFERPVLRRGYLHALNTSELQSATAYLPGIEQRAFVIPNGVPATEPGRHGPERSGVLYLGRLHEKKQTLELAQLWAGAPQLQNIQLTIAGWGDVDYEGRLKHLAESAPNVRFVGSLYGAAKQEALDRAQFFILPSLSEGLPMAVLEAIQRGCIPLITEQCNLPELFKDDIAIRIDSGLGDLVPVVTAAHDLPADILEARSEAARAYSERYLWSSIAAQMSLQYERILREKAQP